MAEMDLIDGLNDAKSIEDLQKLGSVPCQNPDLLLIESPIYLKIAKQSELNGDYEKAYVLIVKRPKIYNHQNSTRKTKFPQINMMLLLVQEVSRKHWII